MLAKELIIASAMICLFFWAEILGLPVAVSAQESTPKNSLVQKSQESGDALKQQPEEALITQKEALRRQRIVAAFQMLLAKARVQHAQIERWHKEHSRKIKAHANTTSGKKQLLLATTSNR